MEIKLPTADEFCKMNNMYPEQETVDKNTDLLARYILDKYKHRLNNGDICPVIRLERYFQNNNLLSVSTEVKWQIVRSAIRRLQGLGYSVSDVNIWCGKELQSLCCWSVKITADIHEAKKDSKRNRTDIGAFCLLILLALCFTMFSIVIIVIS